jgi:hypothetical protein
MAIYYKIKKENGTQLTHGVSEPKILEPMITFFTLKIPPQKQSRMFTKFWELQMIIKRRISLTIAQLLSLL